MNIKLHQSSLNISNAIYINRNIVEILQNILDKLGVMYRIFSRVKSQNSFSSKMSSGKYAPHSKMIQDIIGIRITLYFSDDIEVVSSVLQNSFKCRTDSTSIDNLSSNTFEAIRHNYVFDIPSDISNEALDTNNYCDNTFEVQLRTILSEGWHEIDHDFRYKNSEHWCQPEQKKFDRQLNGLVATLETADWGMLQLFNELAYKNYKDKCWNEMIRHKFRIKLSNEVLGEDLINLLNNDNDLSKKIYRISRSKLIMDMHVTKLSIPLNSTNIIYIINSFYLDNEDINHLCSKNFFINSKILESKHLLAK